MIGITRISQAQIDRLARYYALTDRPEAARRLRQDIRDAVRLILNAPGQGAAFPRPYPHLLQPGIRWRLVRVYWVSWAIIEGRPIITNVLHASADIGRRASTSMSDVLDL